MTDVIVVLIFILALFIVTVIYGQIEVRRYKTMTDAERKFLILKIQSAISEIKAEGMIYYTERDIPMLEDIMTDQQFYQENLIKILESIKEEISDKESKDIVDKYLDRAKAINEFIKEI